MNRSKNTDVKNVGAALITVLLVVSLLAFIILAMLATSTSQLKSSSKHEKIVTLDSLRDSAVNLAIGQLRNATTREGETWSSQPGAIRTYEANGGAPSKIFKLYSDDLMVENFSPANANLENDLEVDWNDQKAVYADLNSPQISATGIPSFPIVDPRAYEESGDGRTPEGFAYTEGVDGVVLGNSDQRLPMPVKWIYLLQDGSIGTLNSSNQFVPFSDQNDANEANPIIGRIAFWTDDESCKHNINTASEAIPWDTPRCWTPEDLAFAEQQPVLNEVQRFSGHPATTCLSSIFFPRRYLTPENDSAELEALYAITPRVSSEGGAMDDTHQRVVYDSDRLYSSVDELLFGTDYTGDTREEQLNGALRDFPLSQRRFFLTANSKSPELNPEGKPKISLWPIHWNEGPSGDGATENRTSYDNVMQFATTLGAFGSDPPFAYQRNTNSAFQEKGGELQVINGKEGDRRSAEQNRFLITYLSRMLGFNEAGNTTSGRPTPGYDSNFVDKYGPVNVSYSCFNLLDYIRTANLADDTLIDSNSDDSLDTRVKPWTRPLGDDHNENENGTNKRYRFGTVMSQFLVYRVADGGVTHNPALKSLLDHAAVGPGNTGPFTLARNYGLSEVALVFCGVVERTGDDSYLPESKKDLAIALGLENGQMAVQIGFVGEVSCASTGYPHIVPVSGFEVNRLSTLHIDDRNPINRDKSDWNRSVTTHSISFPPPSGPFPSSPLYKMWKGSGMGGSSDYRILLSNKHDKAGMKDAYYIVDTNDDTMKVGTTDSSGLRIGHQNAHYGVSAHAANFMPTVIIPEFEIPIPKIPENSDLQLEWPERIDNFATALSGGDYQTEVLDKNDVIRSMVICHGDVRLSRMHNHMGHAGQVGWATPRNFFIPHPEWNSSKRHVHTLYKEGEPLQVEGAEPASNQPLIRGAGYSPAVIPDLGVSASSAVFRKVINNPAVGPSYPFSTDPQVTGDWDTGPGLLRDGAYLNLPDYGTHPTSGVTPYFDSRFDQSVYHNQSTTSGPELTKPNHFMPSAGMFGSQPSLGLDFVPWTTYLFRPELNAPHVGHMGRSRNQKGSSNLGNRDDRSFPPDHMLMEYFWNPVVQPYAISEPFSTSGKVNMNYRLAPFSYITRSTALRGVLKSERLLTIPTNAGSTYKSPGSSNTGWRNPIDSNLTLLQWEERFDNGDYFQTASELCEMFLVPEGKGISGSSGSSIRNEMRSFWKDHQLTGDNVIERPYTNLYPRLTTRSNAYRVHYLVQTIDKAKGSEPDVIDQAVDSISGELQGDALIERYINPQDPVLDSEDYQYHENKFASSLEKLYQFRVRHNRRFAN